MVVYIKLLGTLLLMIHCIYSPTIFAKDDIGDAGAVNNGAGKTHLVEKYKRKSDPLGQQARLPDSIPDTKSMHISLPTDKMAREHMIKKIQLALYLENLYMGEISGVLDIETKRSIAEYKQARGFLPGDILLDSPTLISLGIIGK